MPATDGAWLSLLASATGIAIAAGLVVGIREFFQLRSQRLLDRIAYREMRLSLMQIPPNGLAAYLFAPFWAGIYLAAGTLTSAELPLNIFIVLAAFAAADFSYYWEHRCAHKLPFLWAAYHGVHHTSGAYTVATAYRVSFVNHFFAPAFYLPWILLGFDPLLIGAMQLFVFHYQAWVHTETIGELRWLDGWLNTPANHRMHHSSAVAHRDRNFGGVLMCWDRLFGSYVRPERNVAFGVHGHVPPDGMKEVFLQPLRGLLPRH